MRSSSLKHHGLRDTQPRRMVLEAMESLGKPASPSDIHAWITARGDTVSLVTVYRILAVLERLNLVHRHACNGLLSLCSLPSPDGHHGFMHCHGCGSVEEFSDSTLRRAEDAVATKAKFRPASYANEILGLCFSCVSSLPS